jgi:hypothetical protein
MGWVFHATLPRGARTVSREAAISGRIFHAALAAGPDIILAFRINARRGYSGRAGCWCAHRPFIFRGRGGGLLRLPGFFGVIVDAPISLRARGHPTLLRLHDHFADSTNKNLLVTQVPVTGGGIQMNFISETKFLSLCIIAE